MAIHAHSTPVPALQRGLLRAFAHPLADPESTAAQPRDASGLAPEEALASTALAALSPAPLPSLTSAFSRRRAIFGAVALAAAPVAIAPAAAVAGDFPSTGMSAEAAELQAEFRSVLETYQAAGAIHEAAEAAFVYVEAPEELFSRPSDINTIGLRFPVPSGIDGRRWYAERALIDELRAASFRYMNGCVDERAASRRDEIVGAWDRWLDDTKAAEDACGYTEAHEAYVIAADAYHDFRSRLVEMRTADRAIMDLKAQIVIERAIDFGGLDDMVAAAVKAEGMQQEAMAMSLVRDFIGQLGAAHGEVAHV